MPNYQGRPVTRDYLSDMVDKGLMMDMEGCCCRFCMGHGVAMDEHRGLQAGHIWAGWEGFLIVGVAFVVIGVVVSLIRGLL